MTFLEHVFHNLINQRLIGSKNNQDVVFREDKLKVFPKCHDIVIKITPDTLIYREMSVIERTVMAEGFDWWSMFLSFIWR